jgi:hypothetical protein
MVIQTIKCAKDYPMVGGVIKKGTILVENLNASKEAFDATVFTSKEGNNFHFNNSEIVFSRQFHKSFKLISRN